VNRMEDVFFIVSILGFGYILTYIFISFYHLNKRIDKIMKKLKIKEEDDEE
jgi:hypothetical protein